MEEVNTAKCMTNVQGPNYDLIIKVTNYNFFFFNLSKR